MFRLIKNIILLPFRLIKWTILLALLVIIITLGLSTYVVHDSHSQVTAGLSSVDDTFTAEEINEYKAINPDCIMILGALVMDDGTPSPMLAERLDTGIALYRAGVAPKILISGDNGQVEYNEIDVMKKYVLDRGVPAEDVFMDHAGFSTYDSVYRAKAIFCVDSMIVVSQKYHLFRALYGCNKMEITALGAASNQNKYAIRYKNEAREVLARDKDFVKWLIKPEPTFLGEQFPIDGDGRATDDDNN